MMVGQLERVKKNSGNSIFFRLFFKCLEAGRALFCDVRKEI